MSILVTGGLGYIGSHTVVELLNLNEDVIIVDNLSNSNIDTLDRIESICKKRPIFYQTDIRNYQELYSIFNNHTINSVIHFAGYKAVGESVDQPLSYYDNNLISTITLLNIMNEFNINNFVFSSSATVYGDSPELPIKEDSPLSVTNPYGRTKLMIEDMLRDICYSNKNLNVAILRYFNPVGAHPSGLIGEDPSGIPNNLMPYIFKVALGELPVLNIFGNDYDTHDGTGIRDFIHVVDLAIGHVYALKKLNSNPGLVTYNLGTGKGYSVLDLVNIFEKEANCSIPYKFTDRRKGDIDICFASTDKAYTELGWKANFNINDMCKDTWNWCKSK